MAAKYLQIASQLQSDIRNGKYSEQKHLPPEMELARTFAVSRQTIRQALAVLVKNNIIQKRQGSGSQIIDNPSASQHRNIAVVTTYINDYIFTDVLRDVQETLAQKNYATLVYATNNSVQSERDILTKLLDEPIAGLLIEGVKAALPSPNLDLYEIFKARGIPVVFIHAKYPQLTDFISVTDDNRGGGYMLTRYLLEKGHRQIAGIFKSDDLQGLERYRGYCEALVEYHVPIVDDNILWFSSSYRKSYNDRSDPFLKIFSEGTRNNLSAVVCYNDEIAFHLIQYACDHEIRVPQELSVVSFDDSYYSELSPVRITSLAHGSKKIGKKAAQLLISRIGGIDVRSEVLPWTLIEKESS